jgi:hypothetical protein
MSVSSNLHFGSRGSIEHVLALQLNYYILLVLAKSSHGFFRAYCVCKGGLQFHMMIRAWYLQLPMVVT